MSNNICVYVVLNVSFVNLCFILNKTNNDISIHNKHGYLYYTRHVCLMKSRVQFNKLFATLTFGFIRIQIRIILRLLQILPPLHVPISHICIHVLKKRVSFSRSRDAQMLMSLLQSVKPNEVLLFPHKLSPVMCLYDCELLLSHTHAHTHLRITESPNIHTCFCLLCTPHPH